MSVGESLLVDVKQRDGFRSFVEIKEILIGTKKFGDSPKLSFKSLVPRHARHARDFYGGNGEEEEIGRRKERRSRRRSGGKGTGRGK